MYQDSNQYEDFCDDYDDRSKLSTPVARSPPTPLPAPTSFHDVDAYYDDDDDDDAISSPTLSALFLKESKSQDPSKHQSPIARRPPPLPPVLVSYYNTTEQKDQQDGRDRFQLPPPLPQKPSASQINPPKPTKFNTSKTVRTGYKDYAGNDKSNLKPDHSSDTKPFATLLVNQPVKSGNLSASNEEQCYSDTVSKSSDFESGIGSSAQMGDTYKGSDFYDNGNYNYGNLSASNEEQCYSDTVNKSYDFESGIDSSAQMGDTYKGSDFYETNLLARHDDTQKGSDFYEANPLAKHSDTKRGSDFDISVGVADSHSIKSG